MPTPSNQEPLTDVAIRRRGSNGMGLTLIHYAPGGRHDRHEHDHAQVSFLIAGGVRETIGRRCHEVTVPAVCIKPAGADHENLWGANGALIVSARLRDWDSSLLPRFPTASWVPFATPAVAPAIAGALEGRSPSRIDDAITDLLGLLRTEPSRTRDPPAWLRRVVEAVTDSENLTAEDAARIAGVHRVHLSRHFSKHLGVPFGVFRQRVMLAKAVEAMVRSPDALAEIACDAGFADQSHMHRNLASTLGVTPRRFRNAFRAAASRC